MLNPKPLSKEYSATEKLRTVLTTMETNNNNGGGLNFRNFTPNNFALFALYLIKTHGADINAQSNEKKWSLAHFAAHINNVEMLNELKNLGADFNLTSNTGESPLFLCSSFDAAKVLVEGNANLNLKNQCNQAATQALQSKSINVNILLMNNNIPQNNQTTQKTLTENDEVIESIRKRYNIDPIYKGAPHKSAQENLESLIEWQHQNILLLYVQQNLNYLIACLRQGANVNTLDTKRNWTLAHHAVKAGNQKLLKKLKKHGADFNIRTLSSDSSLLCMLSNYPYYEVKIIKDIMTILADGGAKFDFTKKQDKDAYDRLMRNQQISIDPRLMNINNNNNNNTRETCYADYDDY